MFDSTPVRGEIVNIQGSWQAILSRSEYPEPIKKLLGDLVAAGVLLCGTIKFSGSLIIQAHGNGPLRILVVECDENLNIRATAKLGDDVAPSDISDDASMEELLNPDGQGKLVITIDPSDRKPGQNPYQGIVPLNDGNKPVQSITEAITLYMRSSEQIETRLWLASNDQACAGLLLQKLPTSGGHSHVDEQTAAEGWTRLQIITDTVTNQELLELDPAALMKRLYLDESMNHGVRSFTPRTIHFKCRCTRLKVADVLKMLGEDEINAILQESEVIKTNCEFCGETYTFDSVDCKQLFHNELLSDAVRKPLGSKH